MTTNLFLVLVGVVLGLLYGELQDRVLRPWARRKLGRHLESDHWGLEEQERS
jgi:hypothetical protein